MSASKMRAAAVEGDFDSFQQGLPKGFRDAKNYTTMFASIWVFVKNDIWVRWMNMSSS